jgi:hypothetical protein
MAAIRTKLGFRKTNFAIKGFIFGINWEFFLAIFTNHRNKEIKK